MNDFLDGYQSIDTHGSDLPHWQQSTVMQFITIRLGDAMPAAKLKQWREERRQWLGMHPEPWDEAQKAEYLQFSGAFEHWLDRGEGSCIFRETINRNTLKEVLMYEHGQRAQHEAWVIMPNHAHLLFEPKHPLPQLMKTWKGISARKIGKGSIWQPNYHDTLIRNQGHFENVVRYIRRNPKHLSEGRYTLWQSERALAVPDKSH